jgi:hypothetical protein
VTDLQRAVHERKLAEAAVQVAVGKVMVAERVEQSPSEVYANIRSLVAALVASADATRKLANVLTLSADIFDTRHPDLDTLLPPIIDHEGDPDETECFKPGQDDCCGHPGYCGSEGGDA